MKRKTVESSSQQQALELKKHVAVIHSSNKLTLLQRKIANALLFNAYAELEKKDEHTIHIATLCKLIGYDSNDHKSIKKALVNLLSTVLEWNLVDGERLGTEDIWNASSIIADASIQGPLCTYSYSNKMKKLLYRPNMYGKLDMLIQSKFKSAYGLALYENCNRFQDIGQTPWFDLITFRKLMGVEDGQYKIFRDFKNRVLDKAVKEVNQYSPLVISPQLRKQNRQVLSIQFLIKKPSIIAVDHSISSLSEEQVIAELLKKQFGFSVKQINDAFERYEKAYIKEKIELIKALASYKNGKVKNVARYLQSALRDDYQAVKPSTPEEMKVTARIKKSKHHEVTVLTDFNRFQDKQLISLFHKLPKRSRISILKKFEKFLTGMYQHIYLRSGLENILVQDQLCVFLRHLKHALIEKLITFDAWQREHFLRNN